MIFFFFFKFHFSNLFLDLIKKKNYLKVIWRKKNADVALTDVWKLDGKHTKGPLSNL
jgi:hypothetical protein